MASHGSDTPTSPRAILHHTETILCTFMHTTVAQIYYYDPQTAGINLQSPRSDSTPWTLTLDLTLPLV